MTSSNENIDIVKRLYYLFTKKDINAIIEMLSPEVEWSEPANPYNPAGGKRFGHQGFLEWLSIGKENEDILILEPRKMLADNDTVAIFGYMKCLAKPTGKTYESDFVHLVIFKEGKIIKFQEFFDTYIAGDAFRQ